MLIAEMFDATTLANMEGALERAYEVLAAGNRNDDARGHIASKIVECAQRGDTSLGGLTDAGCVGASELCVAHGI